MRAAAVFALAACHASAPPVGPAHVRVIAAWPTHDATAVALNVAAPLEHALGVVPGIAHMHSWSTAGRTEIEITLAVGTSGDDALVRATEAVHGAMRLLPTSVAPPEVRFEDPHARVAWIAGPVPSDLEKRRVQQLELCGGGTKTVIDVDLSALAAHGYDLAGLFAHYANTPELGATSEVPDGCTLAMTVPGTQLARVTYLGDAPAGTLPDGPATHLEGLMTADAPDLAPLLAEIRSVHPKATVFVRAHDGRLEIDAWNAPGLEDTILLSLSELGVDALHASDDVAGTFTGMDAVAQARAALESARATSPLSASCPACDAPPRGRIEVDRDLAAKLAVPDAALEQGVALANGLVPLGRGAHGPVFARLPADADRSTVLLPGTRIPLSAVARFVMAPTPALVEREDAQPAATVWVHGPSRAAALAVFAGTKAVIRE